MSKCRIIGAGCAGSSVYSCNPNLNTAGGTKKQGLPFSIDTSHATKRAMDRSLGVHRTFIFSMNQLGGGGSIGRKVPGLNVDGIKPRAPYNYNGGPDPCSNSISPPPTVL
jgi:hypothetical protein